MFEPGSRGFILSTVGATAVVSGIAGWRMSRRTAARVLAMVGILLGIFGTVEMITRAAALWAPAWATVATMAMAPTAPTVAAPVVVSPAQAAQRVVALIELSHRTNGSAYPSVITPGSTGTVVTPAGSYRLPAGDAFSYIPASDLSSYRLQVSDSHGAVARYDSVTKAITLG